MAFDPDQYLKEKTAMAPVTSFDPDKYLEEKTGASVKEAPPPDPNDPNQMKGQGLIDYLRSGKDTSALGRANLKDLPGGAAMALGYPAGFVRTGVAQGLDKAGQLMGGGEPEINGKDWHKALYGQAPTSAEYAERLGVPEGPSANLPYIGKVTARGAGGFLSDVVTDPLTHGARISSALNPVGEALEGAGKSTYKSGFKKIDERLLEQNKKPLSDLLLENGRPTGTTKNVGEKAAEIGEKSLNERQALYGKATDAGVSVDLGHPLPRAEGLIKELADNPGTAQVANKMLGLMNKYKDAGKVTLDRLSNWKTALTDSLPRSAFGPDGKLMGPYQKFIKALAGDFQDAIVQGGETAEPGLGNKINKANETMGTVLSSEKPLAMQVRRGETPNLLTSVDAIISGHPGLLALKKGADLSKTTWARTKLGSGLMTAGESGVPQALANQGLMKALTPKEQEELKKKEQELRLSGGQ